MMDRLPSCWTVRNYFMENKYLYGKDIAEILDNETQAFVEECKKKNKKTPKIANLSVGNDPASASYEKGLIKKCEKVGVDLEKVQLKEDVSEIELIRVLHQLNQNSQIDGILIQMPLPNHINLNRVRNEINPDKDLDGIHPINAGRFYQGLPCFAPCTALSAMEFIHHSNTDLEGKQVVVVGRSNVIGKPVAQMCLNEHASVTIVHSKSHNIEEICSRADVLISAVGKARLIKKEWVKKDAVVIDVGVNVDESGKLCGDVDEADVMDKVKYLTPVPKGVGVVTNSMLMRNLIQAYKNRR